MGLNPTCYASQDGPGVGSVWRPSVATFGHPAPVATWILGYAAGAFGRTTRAGELLVDLTSPLLFSSVAVPQYSVAVHEIPVPNDVSLAGTVAATQALILSGRGLELCNALDVVVGF